MKKAISLLLSICLIIVLTAGSAVLFAEEDVVLYSFTSDDEVNSNLPGRTCVELSHDVKDNLDVVKIVLGGNDNHVIFGGGRDISEYPFATISYYLETSSNVEERTGSLRVCANGEWSMAIWTWTRNAWKTDIIDFTADTTHYWPLEKTQSYQPGESIDQIRLRFEDKDELNFGNYDGDVFYIYEIVFFKTLEEAQQYDPFKTTPETQPETQPATQPETKPTTQPETQPTTQPETQPATQPQTGDVSVIMLCVAMVLIMCAVVVLKRKQAI